MSDALATWGTTHALITLMLETAIDPLRAGIDGIADALGTEISNVGDAFGTQINTLRTEINALRTEVDALRRDIGDLGTGIGGDLGSLVNRITALENASAVSIRSPITFVFAGTPVEGSMINIPIVGRTTGVLRIPGTATTPSSTTLGTSRYYNATNPLVPSVFTLTRITAGGATNTIGRVDKPSGTGAATFSGTGAVNVTHGDTLRMTATTIGGSLTHVGISIDATKLY